MHISTIKITRIKVRGKNVDFLTIEITPKKVGGNYVDLLTSKITLKKVRVNQVVFSTIEIVSKKYVETTWIFRPSKLHRKTTRKWRRNSSKIWSLTYWRNIHVESTWIRRDVLVGLLLFSKGYDQYIWAASPQTKTN